MSDSAGNVGRSLALQVAREHHDVYVIELSSFQLENMYDFKVNIAVDAQHHSRPSRPATTYKMRNYINAKFRIIRNQTPEDAFIFWQDDPRNRGPASPNYHRSRQIPLSASIWKKRPPHMSTLSTTLSSTLAHIPEMPRKDLSLHGLHNLYNSHGRRTVGMSAQHPERGYTPRARRLRGRRAPVWNL